MSLHVFVAADPRDEPLPDQADAVLDDDGYYWFLHELFQDLATQTGQYIDLYGFAKFSGDSLRALKHCMVQAKRLVAGQPETWQVHIGTQTAPVPQELYTTVNRQTFHRLLESLDQVVTSAENQGCWVVCLGD